MGLQESLDKILITEGANFKDTQINHRVVWRDISTLRPIELTPKTDSLRYFREEWNKHGNLYSLDGKGPIMVADSNSSVHNGNQRIIFYQLNNIPSVEVVLFTPIGSYVEILNGCLRYAEMIGIFSFNDLVKQIEDPNRYKI